MSLRKRAPITEVRIVMACTVTLTAAESEHPLIEDGRRHAQMSRPPQRQDVSYLTGYYSERQQMGCDNALPLAGAGSDSIRELMEKAFHVMFPN